MINNDKVREVKTQRYNPSDKSMYVLYVDGYEEWIIFDDNDGYKLSEDGILFLSERIKYYKNSEGFECHCKYDSKGNLIDYKDNHNRAYTREFKDNNLMYQEIKNQYKVRYDDCGNILDYTNRYGVSEHYEYDIYGNVIYYSNSEGYTYKYNDNRTSEETYIVDSKHPHQFDSTIEDIIYIFRAYDDRGNQLLYSDNYGYEYHCTYDESNNLIKSELYINGELQEM